LPVLLLPPRIDSPRDPVLWAIATGVAAIAGHVRPVFLKFGKGGKGVATAAGVFLALAPVPMLVTFAVFVAIVLASGYVSLGSLVSAVLLPTLLAVTLGFRSPLFVVSTIIAAFVFWTHRANIGRLRRGEENRFGRRGRA
jgi:glycerol-3-phosphate acyltransferase PlsY